MIDQRRLGRHPVADPAALATEDDRGRAEETVPRGRSRDDSSRRPAVDEEVWLLHVVLARTGDDATLAALVGEYRPLTLSIARRFHRDREPIDDLRQVALVALMAALRRFDPAFGVPFVAFATPTIVGAIKRHYRDQGWALRVPRVAHDLAGPARDATDRLHGELGRAATAREVAVDLGITEADLRSVRTAMQARSLVSLDAPRPDRTDDGDGSGIEVGQVDAGYELAERRAALQDALPMLSSRDRKVLELSYFEGESQKAIAARFGVSQMQVSRWMTSALGRLRGRMAAVPADASSDSAGR